MAYRLSSVARRCNSMIKGKFLQPPIKYSTATNFQRGVKFVKNDPFIKISLSLCVLIAGGTFLVEVYKKIKKATPTGVQILPSAFAHHSVKRQSLVTHLHNEVLQLRAKCKDITPLLYITGPPGSGKTELVRQFCSSYVSMSKKWIGWKSITPRVLSVDAASPELLHISLAEVASCLGLQHTSDKNIEELFSSIMSELSSSQLPWLLVVDDLTRDTSSCFESLINKYLSGKDKCHREGAILITTQIPEELVHGSSYSMARLSPDQSLELLESISGLQFSDRPSLISELLQVLQYNPMAIALAAATLKIYCSLLPDSERQTVIPSYQNMITQKDHYLPAIVDLYCEATISDSRIRHAFDFLGSCNLNFPLLVSVLPIHLGLDFYGIPDELLAPLPLDPLLTDMKSSSEHNSYWSLIKSTIPFLHTDIPSNDLIANALAASQDEIYFLRQSPILSFKCNWHGEFECVTVHPVARRCVSNLFTSVTISSLDRDFVAKERIEFEQNSWFKKFRTFDEKRSLSKFHLMLPGLSSPGVFTQSQFNNLGSKTPHQLDYSQYVHLVSHCHRVALSLASVLRSVKGDMQSVAMKKCLLPHFQALQDFPFISQRDQLSADISLVIIEAINSSNSKRFISRYEDLIVKQKLLFGAKSMVVANSLVDLADLQLSLSNAPSAKKLLHPAIGIYEQVPVHLRHEEFTLDMGHALSSLGLAYDQLGDKKASRECYGQALAISQSVPPSGRVSVQQRKLVASLLVDVTHAYLCLGDLLVARKYSELATMMLESIYPHGHTETVRLLNIRSIVSALLGDRNGSTKFRVEASKLKDKLD